MEEKKLIFDSSGNTWSSAKWGQEILFGKQIFCNRSLNMKNIVAVGFDMDYTLAQYMPETFESLAYNGTIKKLVDNLKYPSELLGWRFDWKYMVRGLVLDKKRGNILKFHAVWGQLMKTGYQNSRFAHQVERFACLYTSKVSNMASYSPDKYYRPSEDFMPHEFDILPL